VFLTDTKKHEEATKKHEETQRVFEKTRKVFKKPLSRPEIGGSSSFLLINFILIIFFVFI